MSNTKPLSILDERPPSRGLDFNQKAFVAALIVFVAVPVALSGFIYMVMILDRVITTMFLSGGPR